MNPVIRLSPPSPERGFDRISPVYEALTRLFPGRWIKRSQCLFLDRVTGCRRALIVGGGNGGFLRSLLESGFRGRVVYVDISGAMIRHARRRVSDLPDRDVDYRKGDVSAAGVLGRDERFDLVCTHYVLDVFEPAELDAVIGRLDLVLDPGGLWLYTDFAPPGGGPLRRGFQRALLRALYVFFGRVCGVHARELPPIDKVFAQRGYSTMDRGEPARGFLRSVLYRKPEASPQAIRSRVTADSEAHPHSAMAMSNSWRSSSRTRVTPA